MAIMIRNDCRQFREDRPCKPHKNKGIHCDSCIEYDPIKYRILIIKLNAIGDVIRTAGIIPALISKYPGAYITWVTEPNAVSLLELVPGIDRIWSHNEYLLEKLLTEPFDLVLGLDNSKEAGQLVYLSKGKTKMGFSLDKMANLLPLSKAAENWYQMGVNDNLKCANRNTYQEILWSICELPLPIISSKIIIPDKYEKEGKEFAEMFSLINKKPIIGFFSGAGIRWPQKSISLSKQKELLNKLSAKYCNGSIILFGGPLEIENNKRLLSEIPSTILNAGYFESISKFASILNLIDILITGDTLPLHIALALKKKVVVYFGPTSPWEIELFGLGEKIIVPLDCISCYKNECNKSPNCSEIVDVNNIIDTVGRVLKDI